MIKNYALLIILLLSVYGKAQSLSDISFGTDSTLDVVTWNIEWFPKNGVVTIDSVSKIITALDADIIACQEIDDIDDFNAMLSNLPNYTGVYDANNFEGLAYIYKSSTTELLTTSSLFAASAYWRPFPRAPLKIEVIFDNQRYVLINNHYKCCGNGLLDSIDIDDEENRRLSANTLLEQYINTNLPDDNVILLGDLNDVLTDDPAHNVFQPFFNLSNQYLFTDLSVANDISSNWSYPSWPSHIDHILITDELFNRFNHPNSSIATIKVDDYLPLGFSDYDADISDHRPVGLKLYNDPNALVVEGFTNQPELIIYPNPANSIVSISFNESQSANSVSVYNAYGQLIIEQKSAVKLQSVNINISDLSAGVYFIVAKADDNIVGNRKLFVQ